MRALYSTQLRALAAQDCPATLSCAPLTRRPSCLQRLGPEGMSALHPRRRRRRSRRRRRRRRRRTTAARAPTAGGARRGGGEELALTQPGSSVMSRIALASVRHNPRSAGPAGLRGFQCGEMQPGEFSEQLKRAFGIRLTPQELDEAVDHFDADGGGTIDGAEFHVHFFQMGFAEKAAQKRARDARGRALRESAELARARSEGASAAGRRRRRRRRRRAAAPPRSSSTRRGGGGGFGVVVGDDEAEPPPPPLLLLPALLFRRARSLMRRSTGTSNRRTSAARCASSPARPRVRAGRAVRDGAGGLRGFQGARRARAARADTRALAPPSRRPSRRYQAAEKRRPPPCLPRSRREHAARRAARAAQAHVLDPAHEGVRLSLSPPPLLLFY